MVNPNADVGALDSAKEAFANIIARTHWDRVLARALKIRPYSSGQPAQSPVKPLAQRYVVEVLSGRNSVRTMNIACSLLVTIRSFRDFSEKKVDRFGDHP